MTVSIDLSELDDLAELLRLDPGKASAAAHKATVAVGAQVQSAAKAAAPADRPWLSTEGIRRKTWSDARSTHTDVFTIPDPEGRPTGVFVEYGTSDTPPQPFLAIQANWAESAYPTAILAGLNPLQ